MSNPNLHHTTARGPPDGTAATPRILQNRSRAVPFPRSVITSRLIHAPGQQGQRPVFSRSLPGPVRPIQQQQMVQQVSTRSSVPLQAQGRQTIVAKPSAVGTSVYVAFRPPVQQLAARTQPPPLGSAQPGQMRHSASLAAGRYPTPIRRIMRGGRLLTPIPRARVSPATPSGRVAVDQMTAPQPFSHLVRPDQSTLQAQQSRNASMPANSNSSFFDLAQAAKKKAASDEMRAALQAGAVYHENKNHEFDTEEENLGHAETYAEYIPSKLRSGLSHPDCVVETASLSSVQPPDVHYQMTIPEELIDTGCISALQLEAVIYACQMHQNNLPSGERCGYLIGDGAGVGKGRTIACIIFENYLLGRKRSIWLSVSSDLRYDSERDFRDIGAEGIEVYQLSKMKYADISGPENGNIKKGVMFATYSSLIGECRSANAEYRSRMKQLIHWCGPDFDGVIVFDECHRAKNLCPAAGTKPTKTGRMVLELQKELPNARVIYASATGASEPKNMAYMTRLGLWGPGQSFPEFSDFINTVERRGVGAMEVVAMDMKQRGMYLARQLSFHGVGFRVQEVPLSDHFVRVYDDSVKVWLECRRQFQYALVQMSGDRRNLCKVIWGQFWASHQRFFKYLCVAAKVDACVQIARDAIKHNKCVVIGLQSTGEARTLEQLEDCGGDLTEFVSTAKAVLQGLVEKHFPSSLRKSTSAGNVLDGMDRRGSTERKRRAKSPDYYGVRKGLRIPPAKRQSTAEEDSDEDENNNESETSESDDSDDELMLGDDDEAWINTLMAEVESSSDDDTSSDDSDGSSESEDDDEWAKKQKQMVTDSSSDDDYNPFLKDTAGDPWEGREPIVDKRMRTRAQMAESKRLKRQKRIDREKRRKEIRKELKKKKRDTVSESLKRTTAMESDAMKRSASQFIESSRIIDSGAADGFGFAPRNNLASIKEELLAAIERLGRSLPTNTLDHLIDELGGPQFVAELTGRKGRVVTKEDGAVGYELRSANADVALEKMNMEEKDMFMRGEKKIAIISEAASSGISLQSDRRAENKLRRVHITLELPWSADKAIQQFGRTHRSNQVSAPEYIFLISELAGEKRFASIVAKRLESLGALTHGDRRATETRDLSQFNLDTKYGRSALDVVCRSVVGSMAPMIAPPSDYMPGNFFEDMQHYMEGVGLLIQSEKGSYTIEREAATLLKFLNRILGLPVHAQNALFQYFLDVLKTLISQAKRDGTYDLGIMDIGTAGDIVRAVDTRVFIGNAQKGSYQVELHKVSVERGVSWEQAMDLYKDHNHDDDGFYLTPKGVTGKRSAVLIYGIGKMGSEKSFSQMCAITRPSTGRAAELKSIEAMKKRLVKATPEETEQTWKEQYENSARTCQHVYFHGKCHKRNPSGYCEIGRRTRMYFILSGAVLSVWPILEEVLGSGHFRDKAINTAQMQLIRIRTEENHKIVGILVGTSHVRALLDRLKQNCSKSFMVGGEGAEGGAK